jgi:hypothetical protein
MIELRHAQWRKSARSGSGTACVEVANLSETVAVRDSVDPDGPKLAFDRGAWSRFADEVKTGRHNL